MSYYEEPNHPSRQFLFTPLRRLTKKPFITNWHLNGLAADDISSHGPFPDVHNIGIIWGRISGNHVDVDLDGPLTIQAADILLPETGMVFGRKSSIGCHRIYKISGSTTSRQIENPETGEMIVEIRGDNSQTMAPLSVHPDNRETIRFEDGKDGEPTLIDRDELDLIVGQIATVSVLGSVWNSKGRHKLALWFSGLCVCNGVPIEECMRVVQAIVVIREDEDPEDRLRVVQNTYDDAHQGKPVEWRSKLTTVIGARTINVMIQWMGGKPTKVIAERKNNVGRTVAVTVDTSTDISTAEGFKAVAGNDLIYGEHAQQFYRLNDGVYDPVTVFAVKGEIIEFLKDPSASHATGDPSKIRSSQSNARINAVLELTKTFVRRDDRQFDQQSHLLGTGNGVLDLSLMELVQPTDVVTKRIGTRYIPDFECPLFKKFIDEVFEGNGDVISYVQRIMGYTLTASVEAQAMFILIGTGANGKSVFLNLLQSLMGDYGTALPPHSIMQGRFGNDKTDDLASLVGKRFVFATEGEAGGKLASAKVKRMTGGDTMSVKRLYQDYFNLKPEFKMWFASNDRPHIDGNDDAIWRRIHLIDFPRTFAPHERDPRLLDKLKGELPGILNWSLKGLQQIGSMEGDFLSPPESVRAATNAYRNENDNISDFIEVACILDESGRVMANDLYNSYVAYSNNSAVEPMNQVMFGRSLKRFGIGIQRMKKGNARTGIILK